MCVTWCKLWKENSQGTNQFQTIEDRVLWRIPPICTVVDHSISEICEDIAINTVSSAPTWTLHSYTTVNNKTITHEFWLSMKCDNNSLHCNMRFSDVISKIGRQGGQGIFNLSLHSYNFTTHRTCVLLVNIHVNHLHYLHLPYGYPAAGSSP